VTNLSSFLGVHKFWKVSLIKKKRIGKTFIHRIPLLSNVEKFQMKKIRNLMVSKVIKMNDSSLLLIRKDNKVHYIR
jgi:hypothetical protein